MNFNTLKGAFLSFFFSLVSPDKPSDGVEEFKASRGWLENFKRRSGVLNFMKRGGTETSRLFFNLILVLKLVVVNCAL